MIGSRPAGVGRSNGTSSLQVRGVPTPIGLQSDSTVASANVVVSCTTHLSPRTETRSPAVNTTPVLWQWAYRGKFTGSVGVPAQLGDQNCNSCPEMGDVIVGKLQYERMAFERPLHDAALYAGAPAVDETDFSQPRCVSRVDVFFDDRRNVARREGMKVERGFNRDANRVLFLQIRRWPVFRNGQSLRS